WARGWCVCSLGSGRFFWASGCSRRGRICREPQDTWRSSITPQAWCCSGSREAPNRSPGGGLAARSASARCWRRWCCIGTSNGRRRNRKVQTMATTKRKSANAEQPGRFAYEGLERVLHEKARLGIMTSLVTRPEGLLFGDLKRLCALTDGNLSRHLEVLREAGLVEVWKGFEKRRTQTLCRLSAE